MSAAEVFRLPSWEHDLLLAGLYTEFKLGSEEKPTVEMSGPDATPPAGFESLPRG